MIILLSVVIFFRHIDKPGKDEINTKKEVPIITSKDTSNPSRFDKTTSPSGKNLHNPDQQKDIKIAVFPSISNTFGYDILIDNNPYIHQPNIPGLQGNDGFKTKDQAMQIAELVAKKIRNNEIPPSVSIEELKKYGIIK